MEKYIKPLSVRIMSYSRFVESSTTPVEDVEILDTPEENPLQASSQEKLPDTTPDESETQVTVADM
jgi:hypothetical protein